MPPPPQLVVGKPNKLAHKVQAAAMADQVAAVMHTQQQALSQMQAEGLLDEQFQQLLALQDETNPDFVTEVTELYFDDAVPKIQRVGELLSAAAPDFAELDAVVHQFKGSSASLGAGGMARLCIRMRELCQQRDVAGCQALVQQVMRERARKRACRRSRARCCRLQPAGVPALPICTHCARCNAISADCADHCRSRSPQTAHHARLRNPADAGSVHAPEAAAVRIPSVGSAAQAAGRRRMTQAACRRAQRRSTPANKPMRTRRQPPGATDPLLYMFAEGARCEWTAPQPQLLNHAALHPGAPAP